jgi:hypothetical protein
MWTYINQISFLGVASCSSVCRGGGLVWILFGRVCRLLRKYNRIGKGMLHNHNVVHKMATEFFKASY